MVKEWRKGRERRVEGEKKGGGINEDGGGRRRKE